MAPTFLDYVQTRWCQVANVIAVPGGCARRGSGSLVPPGGGGCARGSGFCFVSEVRCTLFFLGKNARSIDTQKRVS